METAHRVSHSGHPTAHQLLPQGNSQKQENSRLLLGSREHAKALAAHGNPVRPHFPATQKPVSRSSRAGRALRPYHHVPRRPRERVCAQGHTAVARQDWSKPTSYGAAAPRSIQALAGVTNSRGPTERQQPGQQGASLSLVVAGECQANIHARGCRPAAAPFKERSVFQKYCGLNFSLEACHGSFTQRQAGVMWDSCPPACWVGPGSRRAQVWGP